MTGPKLHYASQFIIAAMDEWGGPVTPTTGTPVYLKQDYDALQAKVRELEERLATLKQQRIKYGPICLVCGAAEPCHLKDDPHSPCTFDPAPRELWDRCKEQKQRISELEERLVDYDAAASECEGQSVLTTLHALKQYGMQLEREKADLEVKLRQVVDEGRAISRLNVEEAVEIGSLKSRLQKADQERDKYRSLLVSQCELQERLDRAEQERDQLRARVERLESALRHIAEARWSPRTTASYDEDARYAYPERESYVRQYAQRALEGNEEHGTRRDE